ncbi:MAG: NADH-quinone oxidoreductase subunit NuoE [Chloroflexota bacterium]|nr:NADH-quinone oxidoreductase subunit NuoE [Chloroflexota bacterium]
MPTDLADLLAPYKGQKGVTIQVLQKVQEELGYLPREAINEISKTLHISTSEIYGVITFYAQFRTTPRGKHIVRICRGTACHVRGGEQVFDAVLRQLGIRENETTPDMEYTLETMACIGACALAPAMVIDQDTFGQVTPAKVTTLFTARERVN